MFWCGDFNYRIDLTYEEVFYFVKRQDWKKLLEFDQLQLQKSSGKVSSDFKIFFLAAVLIGIISIFQYGILLNAWLIMFSKLSSMSGFKGVSDTVENTWGSGN